MLGNVGSAMTMSGLPGLDDEHLAGEDTESNSKKSERKRQREKQRRSDLANAFEELSSLLSRIEPEEDDAGGKKRKRRSSVDGSNEADAADSSGMTRLDVIGRTIEILRRLHRENSELKQSLDQPRRDGGSGDDRVRSISQVVSPWASFSHFFSCDSGGLGDGTDAIGGGRPRATCGDAAAGPAVLLLRTSPPSTAA